MGEIIRFRPREGALRQSVNAANEAKTGEGSAEILLFMGVRYERHDDKGTLNTKGQTRRGRPKKRA